MQSSVEEKCSLFKLFLKWNITQRNISSKDIWLKHNKTNNPKPKHYFRNDARCEVPCVGHKCPCTELGGKQVARKPIKVSQKKLSEAQLSGVAMFRYGPGPSVLQSNSLTSGSTRESLILGTHALGLKQMLMSWLQHCRNV